jgi:hypothetical protein
MDKMKFYNKAISSSWNDISGNMPRKTKHNNNSNIAVILNLKKKVIELESKNQLLHQELNELKAGTSTCVPITSNDIGTSCTTNTAAGKASADNHPSKLKSSKSITPQNSPKKLSKHIKQNHARIRHLLKSENKTLNVNYVAQMIFHTTLQNSKDMIDILNILVDFSICTAASLMKQTKSLSSTSSKKLRNCCRLLGIVGLPPGALSLQQSFIKVAKQKNGYYWRDGLNHTPIGPFLTNSEALHDACSQSNPKYIILLRCLHTIQSNENEEFMSLKCLSTFKVLSLLFREGITPKKMIIDIIDRLLQEPLPLPSIVVNILSEIVHTVLLTSPQLINTQLGLKIENALTSR